MPISSQKDFDRELGQRLVARGSITSAELDEALTEQVVAGGSLSLNLWEIGLATSEELTAGGSQVVGLPALDFERGLRAGRESLERLDAEFVRRAELCGFELEGRRLRVATAKPWLLDLLDEARFRSGLDVEPWFMSDVALRRLLHRRCGIAAPPRYRATPMHRPRRGPGAQAKPRAADETLGEELTSEAEFLALYAGERAEVEPPRPEPRSDANDDDDEELLLSELVDPYLVPIERADEALAALESAPDRRALGEILVRFGLSTAKRVALFTCRKDVWLGWTGGGSGLTPDRVAGIMVPVVQGTVFALVQGGGGSPYLGPLSDHPIHRAFRSALGHAEAGSVGLFPVRHRGRVLFVIYLEAGRAALDVSQVLLLATRVPATLERVAARRQS